MGVTIGERLGGKEEFYRRMLEGFSAGMRVSMPGIVQDFDPVTQTATVQPALREKVIGSNLVEQWMDIPLLLDVPVVLPRAGGFVLTMPIKKGDECLVVFADMCIDAWFSNGGIQNQMERRRHDLSDAFAIIGAWSQPRRLSNYSTSAAQLRTDDGSAYISLSANAIDLVAATIRRNGVPI